MAPSTQYRRETFQLPKHPQSQIICPTPRGRAHQNTHCRHMHPYKQPREKNKRKTTVSGGDRRELSVCSIHPQSDAHMTKVWYGMPINNLNSICLLLNHIRNPSPQYNDPNKLLIT
jgi:hypothetical protein